MLLKNLRDEAGEASHDMKLLMRVYDDIRKPENCSLLHRNVNQEGFPVHEWVFKDFSMLQLPVKNDIPRVDLIRRREGYNSDIPKRWVGQYLRGEA